MAREDGGHSSTADKDQAIWLSATALIVYGVAALLLLAVVVGLVIVHFQLGKDIWLLELNKTENLDHWGQVGDFIGGVLNPIFSFAAFIALLFTFNKQLEDGKKAARESKKLLDNHRFFEFVSLTHEAARGVEIDDQEKTYHNHRALGRSWNIFEGKYHVAPETGQNLLYETLISEYSQWRKKYWLSVSSYIESVLFIVDNYIVLPAGHYESSTSIDSNYFLHALKAQMSVNERDMLFVEMLRSKGWHRHLKQLHQHSFWGNDGGVLDKHRHGLIDQAIARS